MQGGGERAPGAASRLFRPLPPSRRRVHCLRPSSSRSHRSSNLPLQTPAALDVPNSEAGLRPRPLKKAWGFLDSWPWLSPEALLQLLSSSHCWRSSHEIPGDGRVQFFRATDPATLNSMESGTWKATPGLEKGESSLMLISGERWSPFPKHTGISLTPTPPYSPSFQT